MGFFDFLKSPDIDAGVLEYHGTPGAVLLDVRTPQEYREGHIPGSINIPLQSLHTAGQLPAGAPLFVYCHSGARSRQAAGLLSRMGFQNVKISAAMAAYTGKVER